MTAQQLDLFSEGAGSAEHRSSCATTRHETSVPASLDDAALIEAIPDARIANAPELAAEAFRRRSAVCLRTYWDTREHNSPECCPSLNLTPPTVSDALYLANPAPSGTLNRTAVDRCGDTHASGWQAHLRNSLLCSPSWLKLIGPNWGWMRIVRAEGAMCGFGRVSGLPSTSRGGRGM